MHYAHDGMSASGSDADASLSHICSSGSGSGATRDILFWNSHPPQQVLFARGAYATDADASSCDCTTPLGTDAAHHAEPGERGSGSMHSAALTGTRSSGCRCSGLSPRTTAPCIPNGVSHPSCTCEGAMHGVHAFEAARHSGPGAHETDSASGCGADECGAQHVAARQSLATYTLADLCLGGPNLGCESGSVGSDTADAGGHGRDGVRCYASLRGELCYSTQQVGRHEVHSGHRVASAGGVQPAAGDDVAPEDQSPFDCASSANGHAARVGGGCRSTSGTPRPASSVRTASNATIDMQGGGGSEGGCEGGVDGASEVLTCAGSSRPGCDVFEGRHGEPVLCGAPAQLPLRRVHSAPLPYQEPPYAHAHPLRKRPMHA